MKKTILAMMATAAALCAQAETIELLANGAGTTLDGWEGDGFRIGVDGDGKSCFCPDSRQRKMLQTVTLADFGLSEEYIRQHHWIMTASAGVSPGSGSSTYGFSVEQQDGEGTTLDTHSAENTSELSVTFSLNVNTRYITYMLYAVDSDSAALEEGTKFFDCSVICERRTVKFVSSEVQMGTTIEIGTESSPLASIRPPIAVRNEKYHFLGYFTDEAGGEQVYNANYEYALDSGSSWKPYGDVTLYAHWAPAGGNEGGVTNLVYRGVLSNFGKWTSGLSKTMRIKVYDSASSATPLWSGDAENVPINPDGSFEALFGDGDLAMTFASNDVTHVELTVGDALSPIAPRRSFTSVASVNRALVAEGAADDVKIGTLGANAIVAEKVSAMLLEASETVRVEGSVSVEVKPFDVDVGRETTIWRGAGVTAWGDSQRVATASDVAAGQLLWTADRDGVAVVHATGTSRSTLRIPATIQFVRPGDEVRAPTWENGEVSVTVWGYKR